MIFSILPTFEKGPLSSDFIELIHEGEVTKSNFDTLNLLSLDTV